MNGRRLTGGEETHGRCPKCGDKFPWVRLFPYKHQVSGHHRVMLFNDTTICKPLMSKEYEFYKSVPPSIKRFVPKLKGIARASAKTDENGHDVLYALPVLNNDFTAEIPCECNNQSLVSNGSYDGSHCKWKYTPGQDEIKKEYIYDEHPWVQKTQQMTFERNMHKTEGSKLILLEQIGYGYAYPCIIDLKMGVQQYGDGASETKIRHQKERCEKSTSSSLGVRLCGMQVYDPVANTYFYTDKYAGRQFDDYGFKKCLYAFLNEGKRLDVIDPIADLLGDLQKGIDSLPTCRFFGSSLLLLYDGDPQACCSIEIRMIDFANVSLYKEEHIGPDCGYTFGLTNLCRLFKDIKSEFKVCSHVKRG